jgi:protein-tyrosine-phosphatase/DNA-binding transcriptional ArsR family regulator
MSVDLHDLLRRARVHAALAEPARLQVVDRLRESDASPAELRSLLGIPSNLLTHHLHVLEREGLLRRRRSDGDRRRTYLQLVPEVLEDLLPRASGRAGRVVFVCTANTARSQLAAALWHRASSVPATSAGTHPADRIAAGTVATAERHRLPLRQVAPRVLEDVLTEDDYVVTVCDNAHEELQRRYGDRRDAAHWSVPDPVAVGSAAAFDAVYDDLATRVTHLADRLTPR